VTATELSLRERLVAVQAAAARDARRSPEAARALLESRARRLARKAASDDDATADAIDLLVVEVGDDRLALPVASIVAISRPGSIAPLPRAVAPVYGVTGWRGRPLTVLSLGARRPGTGAASRLVVLGTGSRAMLAIVVDAVDDIVRAARAGLTAAGTGPRRHYALGVTPDGLLVIDGERLLRPESLTP
jgi:chemotaxis signal transduction protein